MVTTKEGLHGKLILTITDGRGNVIVHETVKPEDVDTIIERNTR
jgi:hypothetical protein